MQRKITLVLLIIFLFSLIGCKNMTEVENIINEIDMIEEVNNLKLEHENNIVNIRSEYEKLSDKEKVLVTNYDKLVIAEYKIKLLKEEQKLINEIIDLINELPSIEDISLEDEHDVKKITDLLSVLTDIQKTQIINLDTYNNINNIMNQMINQKTNEQEAQTITDLINSLPYLMDITIEHKSKINDIRKQYNNSNEDVKTLVSNYELLLELEKTIKIIENYGINPYTVLNCISDIATSYTNDQLYLNENNLVINYSSSKPDLYYFEDGYGKVSRVYQTHKCQTVDIAVEIIKNNNESISYSKQIIVEPVLFDEMSETPVATYFQTSALSSYTSYSNRYKTEKTLFSEKASNSLDIIYYAFAHLDEKGNITLSDENIIPELIKMKQHNVRNILCLAGVSTLTSKYFTEVTGDDKLRKQFVINIVDYVEKYNFDGVDVDWESTGGYNVIADNMNKLTKELREELDRRQDPNGTPYLLTIAVPATSDGSDVDRFEYTTLNNYVDFYNIMSYALNHRTISTHVAPLYTSSYDNGHKWSVDFAAKLIVSRGADNKKIIIGSGAYGKAFKVIGTSANELYPGLGATASLVKINGVPNSYASGTVFLNGIKTLKDTGNYKEYNEYNKDGQFVGSYLYSEKDKIFVSYDSELLIKAKYEYAKENKYGIMCWAYTQDTYDAFVNTIYSIIYND